MRTLYRFLMFLAVISGFASPGWSADHVKLRVISWNVQSGGSDAKFLAKQMAEKKNVALWGLSEVDPKEFETFRLGAQSGGSTFNCIEGSTGGNARSAIIYNAERFELLQEAELKDVQGESSHVSLPLVAHLRCRKSHAEFLFAVNHLFRGDGSAHDEKHRAEQARRINAWAGKLDLPAIVVGTFNAEYDCRYGSMGVRSPVFDELVRNEHLQWIRPQTLVRTQTSFDSVSDFVFVANPRKMPGWNGISRILNQTVDSIASIPYFYDDSLSSDHRPVDATFTLPLSGG